MQGSHLDPKVNGGTQAQTIKDCSVLWQWCSISLCLECHRRRECGYEKTSH